MYAEITQAIDELKELINTTQNEQLDRIENRLGRVEKELYLQRKGHERFDWDEDIKDFVDEDEMDEDLEVPVRL